MASLREFARRMRVLGRRVEVNGPEIARKAALAVDQAVVTSTPVDSGRARSNWIARVGGPASGTREAFVPGAGGSTGPANAQAAIVAAEGVIRTFDGEGEIHLTNNLPYIARLNTGYSAQAPAGFVDTAIQAGVRRVRRSKILRENP
ncbi:gp81 [Alphaproteobacteria phage PhiJL001]|uniref:Gp81 n=1 Tax=Alphaproteobacteria phage PhiJL001 TaxID=2681607 RepID=Q5DN24_9CAUD|nr:tail completion or Neck1 protein [Alphaproteobacteria phage PhiJL001]AAT69477.1 gp81 [Alphaproteobacteria phage PhiJL001]